MTHCTLAVIGHVDHGKTSLVHALTGIETDRLEEEKRRSLSIALGFAWRDFPTGGVDLIDAPGHEDFIRTMACGASGARAILLAVSAVDGFERQTVEHLRIAAWLGIGAGVVAVTKCDLLPADQFAARDADIEHALIGTPLQGQPIVFCSSKTGAGMEALASELTALVGRCPAPPTLPGAFLPVDRVFSVRGAGTVVTGTLLGAALRVGDAAVLQPSGREVTVRGLQSRGMDLREIAVGRRTAVNIRGASVQDIRVGDVLCSPRCFMAVTQVDAKVTLSPACARPLKHLEDIRLLFGTRGVVARLRVLDGQSIAPGESGWVQLRFDSAAVAFTGQRAILRRLSPAETIGGAVILDPAPSLSARRNAGRIAVLRSVETGGAIQVASALAERHGGLLCLAQTCRLTNVAPGALRATLATDFDSLDDACLVSRRAILEAGRLYLAALAEAHRAAPAKAGWPLATIRRAASHLLAPMVVTIAEERLANAGDIVVFRGRVALAAHDPIGALSEDQRITLAHIEDLLRDGGATPPDPTQLHGLAGDEPDLLDLLVASGRAIGLVNHALRKTLLFHPAALEAAVETLAAAFPGQGGFTTGEAREALSTSRKFIVPILEYFDARGWTIRTGDLRRIAARE